MGTQIICGDALSVLATLPAASVQVCITSPPYFNLRAYKGGPLEIGTESTPQEYVAHLVDVFAQVKRVLRADGTLWVVIGDSYASAWPCSRRNLMGQSSLPNGKREARPPRLGAGLKEKDLIGIPWMLAFALRDDGWYLRQEIVWSKPAPMPESVTDRCTRSHETIFMLSKRPQYFYDATSIAEPCATADDRRNRADYRPQRERDVGGRSDGFTRSHGAMAWPAAGRNKRSVWTIGPQPLAEDHYAAFPEKLVAPMVLAGTSEAGCCPRCLAPWRRVVERTAAAATRLSYAAATAGALPGRHRGTLERPGGFYPQEPTTRGWEATCPCDAGPPIGCTVLDCFAGSGTVGLVCRKLGRSATLIELNESYVRLIEKRIASVPEPLFTSAV